MQPMNGVKTVSYTHLRKQREKKASLLELLFGNFHKDVDAKPNKKVPKKGENIETEIQITVEERCV